MPQTLISYSKILELVGVFSRTVMFVNLASDLVVERTLIPDMTLAVAERSVTQLFNLFGKVLIPKTKGNIKTIQICLVDAERAGVINSKLAKSKKEKEVA